MADMMGIRLNDGRLLPFLCDFSLNQNDSVIVEVADNILEFGVFERVYIGEEEPAGKVLHIASESEIKENNKLLSFKKEDKQKVLARVKTLDIQLKLVSVLRSFDGKKLLVMYTSEDRVDFRQLVRDLAGIFHMRVEMRQISEREEARYCGGCGQCGQPLCCRRFLNNFKQTSIKMAKTQGLALNPNKVNGVCGKLMCCLQYENDQYKEIKAKMPNLSSLVETKNGKGEVIYLDLLKEMVAVKLRNEAENIEKFTLDEIKVISKVENAEENDE